jgi:hypothetical protein
LIIDPSPEDGALRCISSCDLEHAQFNLKDRNGRKKKRAAGIEPAQATTLLFAFSGRLSSENNVGVEQEH